MYLNLASATASLSSREQNSLENIAMKIIRLAANRGVSSFSLHQRQQLLEAEGGGRSPGPGQGLGLAGVQVDNREDDAHHHVGLKNVRKIILF